MSISEIDWVNCWCWRQCLKTSHFILFISPGFIYVYSSGVSAIMIYLSTASIWFFCLLTFLSMALHCADVTIHKNCRDWLTETDSAYQYVFQHSPPLLNTFCYFSHSLLHWKRYNQLKHNSINEIHADASPILGAATILNTVNRRKIWASHVSFWWTFCTYCRQLHMWEINDNSLF